MGINLFNCNNEVLFADGQLLFKKTFINKDDDLLKNILEKYSKDPARLLSTWNRVLGNQSVLTENERELAVILILNAMVLEAENYIIKEVNRFKKENGVNNDADPRVSEFQLNQTKDVIAKYKTPRLENVHTSLFVNNILPIYENAVNSGVSFTKTHEDLNLQSRFLTPTTVNYENCSEFDARFPIQDSESYRAFRLGNEGEPLLTSITYNGSGFVPKGVMSINTLVFPTTVAPTLASKESRGPRNPEIAKMVEHISYHNRISATGSLGQKGTENTFKYAVSLVNDATNNGTLEDLITSAQSDLESSVQTLSQDRSSPYFGMAPKDIKAGFLSKLLGGSNGYNEFAFEIDKAVKSALNTIHNLHVLGEVEIENEKSGVIQREELLVKIEEYNQLIAESTDNVQNLLSWVSPILEIDAHALAERGLSDEPNYILEPNARENSATLTAGAVTFTITASTIAIIIVAATAIVIFIKVLKEREKTFALQSILNQQKRLRDLYQRLKGMVTVGNLEQIKTELGIKAGTYNNIIKIYNKYSYLKDDIVVGPELEVLQGDVDSLKVQILDKRESITLNELKTYFGIQIEVLKTNIESNEASIKLQEKRTEEAEKYDVLGSVLKVGTRTAKTAGDILKYAGYIALGMFSIWGGVKVYRSLNK